MSTTIFEKWIEIILRTISSNKLGPTYVARFLYLTSTIMYYIYACFTHNKNNCLIEPELTYVELSIIDESFIDYLISISFKYLYTVLNYPQTELLTPTMASNNNTMKLYTNIKLFLDNRNTDGWSIANNPIQLQNGNSFIDVENPQNLSSILTDKTKWTPLKHKNNTIQKYLTPGWGDVLPIPNIDITKYILIADENYIPSQRINEINEILNIYKNLNDNQRMIAEYCQGGQVTPPGIWNIFALYILKSQVTDVYIASEFFYILNSVLFTASIVAWKIKRKYLQARPIQEIRCLYPQQVTTFDGTSVNNTIWKPFQQQLNQTPPFPDYISGHSTFSSGAAVVFEHYFKNYNEINFKPFNLEHANMISPLLNNTYNNTIKAIMIKNSDSSVVMDNNPIKFPTCAVKLTFTSWRDIANASGISRIYGGIHGNNANNVGLIIGEEIGMDILNRANLYS